jgi:hypothetical protein
MATGSEFVTKSIGAVGRNRLAHGVTELWTADRDFSRFPALRIRNPCVS